MMIIWCMNSEIWSTTDRIFGNFELFFALLPPDNPKNQNFEKMKKLPRDIIILYMCTINENLTMYGIWDMEHDRYIFFSFWAIFCPFTPLTTQKVKILKKNLEISFYTSVPKNMIICYTVSEIWCMMNGIIFHFGPFFLPFYHPNSPKIQN